jgi:hypothetical protein
MPFLGLKRPQAPVMVHRFRPTLDCSETRHLNRDYLIKTGTTLRTPGSFYFLLSFP